MAGVGNIFFGDDGFGPEVVRVLEHKQLPEGVRVVDYGIRGVHLAYDLLESWDALVLIDVLPAAGCAGALHVFEVDGEYNSSTEGMDAHAVEPNTVFSSLIALGGTAPRTFVVGAHAESLDEGIGLTPTLRDVVPGAASMVAALLASMAVDEPSAETGR